MTANEDLIFVELALKRELVTQEQVDEILELQKKLTLMGLTERVADLMVKRGVVSEEDGQSLRINASPKGGRQQIEGYRLIERLGRGGMGSVYKAVQLSMKRPVALKVLKPSLVKSDQQTARLRREAQLVGKLKHPNIVQGLDFGISNGFHYFAMEYVDGESLRSRLEEHGPIKEKRALEIVRAIADALDHAQTEGVVHRDIKPGNILLARDGSVKLADYGLAKGPLDDVELTHSGVTVGTPQYISPEQARGPSEVDVRTDLYSLGATLYHMVTGRPPYEGDTLAHLIQQVLYEPYAPPRTLRRDLSPNTAYLIEKLMARRPRHRYQTPKELLRALDAIEAGRSIVPPGWEGDFETFHLRRRYRRILAAAMAVLLVAATASVLLVIQNRKAERARREIAAESGFQRLIGTIPSPAGLDERIRELDEFEREFAETAAAVDARKEIDRLKAQRRNFASVLDDQRKATDLARSRMHGSAIETLELCLRELPEENSDLARGVIQVALDNLRRQRDADIEKVWAIEWERATEANPRDARVVLDLLYEELGRRGYGLAETRLALDQPGKNLLRLRKSIEKTERLLAEPARLLNAEGKRNYIEIQEALDRANHEFRVDPQLSRDLPLLPENWTRSLKKEFADLGDQVLTANRAEGAVVLADADRLVKDGGFYDRAIAGLDELYPRSLPEVAGEVGARADALRSEIRTLETAVEQAVRTFLPAFVDALRRRHWEEAEARKNELRLAADRYQPNDRFMAIVHGAEETLRTLLETERQFLARVDGNGVPGGLGVGTIRYSPVQKVDVNGRMLRIQTDTGWLEPISVAMLDIEDLVRESGEDPRTARMRSFMGIVRFGELRASGSARALQKDLPKVEGEILVARSDPVLGPFIERIVALLREEQSAVQTTIQADEGAALTLYEKARKAFGEQRWQEAYEGFKRLLEEKKFRETDWVQERKKTIEGFVDEAKAKLPAVKLAEHFATRAVHLAGASLGRGHYRVALCYDFESTDELRRWSAVDGLVGIVEVKNELIGPPVPGPLEDGGIIIAEHRLRFSPARDSSPEEQLDRHPLRLESPFIYSREMSISFSVRWERPFALVLSLCGTNLVVLSDDGRLGSGRGVHIWQSADLSRPDRSVPDLLRNTSPEVQKAEDAFGRLFQFEPDRWYRVRFSKDDKTARLDVDGRRVFEQEIEPYAAKSRDILITTYTPCDLDELRIEGSVDPLWYDLHVMRGK